MQKKISLQFEGFISTKPLWINNSLMGLKQFYWPMEDIFPSLESNEDYQEVDSTFVLGKRAEIFFKLAIQSSRDFKLLASNIQISREKITLGEIDFLLKNLRSEKIYHVELVYKFYIYDPSFPEELQRWNGPNRKDSLLRKIDRLKTHQLPLLHLEETKDKLDSFGIKSHKIEQQVSFLANLFIPKDYEVKTLPCVNNACIKGYWIQYHKFLTQNYEGNYFFTPKKQDWPIQIEKNTTWFSFSEILPVVEELILQKKSPLIWMKTTAGIYERFFIVWW